MLMFSLIFTILWSFGIFYCNGEEEGSPHFQIDHKSGKLDILATRTSADIQSKEDFVDLVMKPGKSLTPFYSHDTHHEVDTHHQRHDMPHEEQGSSKSGTNGTKDDVDTEMEKNKSDNSLNNSDGKWMDLFEFPKINRTVDSNVRRNITKKNETEEEIEERETAKMIELQHDADVLAKLVEKSSTKNINPKEIKDAAAKLESKAERLQSDFVGKMLNQNETEEGQRETEQIGQNSARTSDDKNDDKDNKKSKENDEKEGNKENEKDDKENEKDDRENGKDNKDDDSKKNCSNCGAKIPKPGQKIEEPIVPKLSKGKNETTTEKARNKNKRIDNFNTVSVNETKEGATNETRIGSADHANYFETGDGKPKAEKGPPQNNLKGKKLKGKSKKEQKNEKNCGDCGAKVPKPGQTNDDGKLIVPKLTAINETGGKVGFAGEENDKKNNNKNVNDTNGKGEQKEGNKEEDLKENAKTSKDKNCKNCQEKFPKPGDKDDGKLAVPKLTKENETEKAYNQSESNMVNVEIPKSSERESFDLDDDSQEITEDANYDDLSTAMPEKENVNIQTENESRTDLQLSGNHSHNEQEPANMTTSRDIDGRQEEKKTPSDAAQQKKRTNGKDKEKHSSSNKYEKTKEENFEKTKEDGSNADTGSNQEVELFADEIKTEKKANESANEMKNEGQKNTDDNEADKNESKIANDKRVNEDQKTKNTGNVERQGDEQKGEKSTKKKGFQAKSKAVNFADKVETIKQFDKLLSRFLNNSSPEKGKELLKLTWHDLRQRYAQDGKVNGDIKVTNSEKDKENGKMNDTRIESGGTARTQKLGAANTLTKNDDFESTIGRIKKKLSLLHELVEYTKIKKRQKLRKKFDPYAGFKRGEIRS